MDELVESVMDYIRKPYTDHAIMINGEWGSGKTYFWNNKVKSKIESADINGKRYASNPDYENIFKSKYKYICDNTNLETKISAMKSYAIKCNR